MRAGWGRANFDAQSWPTIDPQNFWEGAGIDELATFDGVVWYRTEFTVTAAQAARGGRLALGPADDIDLTRLNGQTLGSSTGWETPRVYDIAPSALHAGHNVLAIGVLDTGGGGGLWGPKGEKILTLADGAQIPLDGVWRYHIAATLAELASAPPQPPWGGPNAPTALHNAMIAPLAPYGLAGVLWYQGEANVGEPAEYARLMPAWMRDWRRAFANPELPFMIVQLANFGAPAAGAPQHQSWGALRDVQRRVVAADAHAGLAVAIDIGDRYDIHPTQKRIVAERLARIARHAIYGETVETSGPTPINARRTRAEIVVRFAHTPLIVYSATWPIGFELCTTERACRFVDARVEGDAVRLAGARRGDAFVRFCWGDGPICNLYNSEDLPAVPFEIAVE